MAKYHIKKNGSVGTCMAFFKPCPLGEEYHFDDKKEAQRFSDEWNSNKAKFPTLIDTPILDPKNNGKISFDEFESNLNGDKILKRDGSKFNSEFLTKDSFVMLDEEIYLYREAEKIVEDIEYKRKIGIVGNIVEKYDFINTQDFKFSYGYNRDITLYIFENQGLFRKEFGRTFFDSLIKNIGTRKTLEELEYKLEEISYKGNNLLLVTPPDDTPFKNSIKNMDF